MEEDPLPQAGQVGPVTTAGTADTVPPQCVQYKMSPRWDCSGVDGNRNWPVNHQGDCPEGPNGFMCDKCAEVYPGPEPFSEVGIPRTRSLFRCRSTLGLIYFIFFLYFFLYIFFF